LAPVFTADDLVRVLYARAPVRLLIVESDTSELAFLQEWLRGLDGAMVVGAEAKDVAREANRSAVDLVVVGRAAWSDDDTELCRHLHAARLSAPVLAVTGPCDVARRAAALRAGADDFLAIPFDLEELVARVGALVRRAASGSRHARAGDLSVDFARRQVLVAGRPLALTLREYDLLAMLIERAGEVVSRQELSGAAMSGEAEKESNVVDVLMSRIRDKLGPRAARIETVRGTGYRLRP
jgi:two-component system OmpR family response regulator